MNLSALQVQSDHLANAVVNALAWSGLAADRLELEVTESIFLRQGPRTEATLKKLGGLGVGLALDDFGTGYSSLGYLQRAAFSKIKIDQAQTALMRQMGCSQLQGFRFEKPVVLAGGESPVAAVEAQRQEVEALLASAPRRRSIRQASVLGRPAPGVHPAPFGACDSAEDGRLRARFDAAPQRSPPRVEKRARSSILGRVPIASTSCCANLSPACWARVVFPLPGSGLMN